jgi:hypothetical protein
VIPGPDRLKMTIKRVGSRAEDRQEAVLPGRQPGSSGVRGARPRQTPPIDQSLSCFSSSTFLLNVSPHSRWPSEGPAGVRTRSKRLEPVGDAGKAPVSCAVAKFARMRRKPVLKGRRRDGRSCKLEPTSKMLKNETKQPQAVNSPLVFIASPLDPALFAPCRRSRSRRGVFALEG